MWMLPLYLHVNQKSDYDDIYDLSTTILNGPLRINYLNYVPHYTQELEGNILLLVWALALVLA